jgi:hypothetical protein
MQGQVVEASSARPISGAMVQIEGPLGSATTTTDAAGRYEVIGLKPGSYSVSATATGYVEGYYGRSAVAAILFGAPVAVPGGHITTGIDVGLHRAGSISGRVTDAAGDPLLGGEVEVIRENGGGPDGLRPAPVAFAQTTADGSYQLSDLRPGDYYLRAYSSRVVQPTANGVTLAYASTFYPGVRTLNEAQPLRLYPGQELLDIDIALGTTRRFRVSGTVSDASGESIDGLRVVLHATASSGGPAAELSAHVDKAGRFEIRDVAPNTYMVTARDVRRPVRWFSATQTLTVTADVADLEVRAKPGAYLVGRVLRDAGAAKPLAVAGLGVGFEIRVAGLEFISGMGPFRVAADGTFSVESPGGPVVFKVMNVPTGWMVKSIHLDGGQIDNEPIDFGAGRRDVEIILTDQVSGVSGVVVDRDGRALPNHSVVVFPDNPARWHPSSRFILAAQSNNVGQFRIDTVSPGDYLAVAVAGLPMNAWRNPDVLSRLQSAAERLRVGEGQRLTIAIGASPTPDGLEKLGGR